MRTLAAVLAMAVILAVPLGLMGPASAASPGRDLTPAIIGPVITDRLGGGDLVAVKAGDAVFGVVYGTSDHRNDIVIFAEYKRFLGGADIYDARGDYLATRGIPVYTVLAQSLNRFIEFQQKNATDGFDLMSVDSLFPVPLTQNVPVKARTLVAAWSLSDLTNETSGGVTLVNFTVSANDLNYTRILDPTGIGDGKLSHVAFTFHLTVDTRDKTARVPWYKVMVDDGNRYDITHVQFEGYKNVTGPAAAMGAKSDHNITGCAFAYPGAKLALATPLLFRHLIPEPTPAFSHV